MECAMNVIQVVPGCHTLNFPQGNALFGCPPEILKHLIQRNLPLPDVIVLPDTFHRFGISQVAVEFPLYHFLFVQQGLAKGRRMKIVGTPSQCDRIAKLMRITLLGPSDEEMKRWGVSKPVREMLVRELDWLVLKNAQGEILQVHHLFDFVYLDSEGTEWVNLYGEAADNADAPPVDIRKTGHDTFEVRCGKNKKPVDCHFTEPQKPPYPVAIESAVDAPARLAVRILGASNGFDPHNPTNGLVFWVNGVALLWDAMPWVDDHLRAKGLSRDQIHAIILSHVHDDHCHFVDILSSGPRPRVITTAEVWHSLLIKMSAIFGESEETIAKWMDWIPITTGKTIPLYGAHWKFFHGVHSIPAFGVRLTVADESGRPVDLLYTGDTNNFEALEKMLAQGALDPARYNAMTNIVKPTDALALIDAGGPPIHGMTKDYVKFEELQTQIIVTHRSNMTDPKPKNASLAQPGSRYDLVPLGQVSTHHALSVLETLRLFNVADSAWANVILARGRLHEFKAGEAIVEEGAAGNTFYFLLAGDCEVTAGSKMVAQLHRGDFFGEIALLTGRERTASVSATTPVSVFELDGETFIQFVQANGLEETFAKLWRDREVISEVEIFEGLEASAIHHLALGAREATFQPAETILDRAVNGSGSFHIIREGKVKLLSSGKPLKGANGKPLVLSRGAYFGPGMSLAGVKNFSAVAMEPTQTLVIPPEALRRLQRDKSIIRHKLGLTLAEH